MRWLTDDPKTLTPEQREAREAWETWVAEGRREQRRDRRIAWVLAAAIVLVIAVLVLAGCTTTPLLGAGDERMLRDPRTGQAVICATGSACETERRTAGYDCVIQFNRDMIAPWAYAVSRCKD